MASIDAERLSSLIESIYAAAYGRVALQSSMTRFAEIFDASRAYTLQTTFDAEGNVQRYPLAVMSIEDAGFGSAEAAAAFAACPTYSGLMRMFANLRPGALVDIADYVDAGDLVRTSVWQDWFRPRDMFHNLQGSLEDTAPDTRFVAGLCRGLHQEPFGMEERKLYKLLAPHLSRAGEISELIGDVKRESAFDMLPVAIVAVDRLGRIKRLNAMADALLSRTNAAVTIRNGGLRAARPVDQQALVSMLASVFMAVDEHATSATIVLPQDYHNDDDRGRVVVSAAPLVDSPLFPSGGESCAIVTIREVKASVEQTFVSLIARLFNLAPSHARLAARLSSGMPLKEAGAANGISYASARSYLEVILQKTGTHRQAELVALLKSIEPLRSRNAVARSPKHLGD
jgi:DNA-binding CsgD family transcriptional regulator